jgi:hypothetical protein
MQGVRPPVSTVEWTLSVIFVWKWNVKTDDNFW